MQEKTSDFLEFFSRVRKLQFEQGITQAEACDQIGLSVSMLHQIKKGRYGISPKARFALEKAEVEAGIRSAMEVASERFVDRARKEPSRAGKIFEQEAAYVISDQAEWMKQELKDKLNSMTPTERVQVLNQALAAANHILKTNYDIVPKPVPPIQKNTPPKK